MLPPTIIPPEHANILDEGHIYSVNDDSWEHGYPMQFRRQKVVRSLKAVKLDGALSSFISESVFCAPFNYLYQMIEWVKVGTPGVCVSAFEVSPAGVRWWSFTTFNVSTSFLRLQGQPCYAPYARIRISSTGLSAVNYWLVDAFDVLNTHI